MESVFTKQDYQSSDGMLTKIWGPSMWHFLHTMSFNYPVKPTSEQKEQYREFIISLGNILPCRYCRDNLKKNLKASKFSKKVFKNRDTFSRWMYRLHNNVNVMLGKSCGLTYNDVRDRYESFRSRCLEKSKKKTRSRSRSKSKVREKGCTNPLYGFKSRCVIEIVPSTSKKKTFKVDPKCKLSRK